MAQISKPSPHLVLLVLPGVREAGDDRCDSGGRCDFAGVDHNQKLHKVIVDFTTAALDYVHILSTHTLSNLHTAEDKHRQQCIRICIDVCS